VGELVTGAKEGDLVGLREGNFSGEVVGAVLGCFSEGEVLGDVLGFIDGLAEGNLVGLKVGNFVGNFVGEIVGPIDGGALDVVLGCCCVGELLGEVWYSDPLLGSQKDAWSVLKKVMLLAKYLDYKMG
jgi:hypothetical protein